MQRRGDSGVTAEAAAEKDLWSLATAAVTAEATAGVAMAKTAEITWRRR
jgi:hypothetical protein